VRLGGAVIEPGSLVIVSLLAANRDPAGFAAADRLDLAREHNPHTAFGYGFHYCLGAPLARLEGAIALRSLLTRFPRLSAAVPAASLRWRVSLVMHGLESLPVRLR
jgi:cytochrome P450